MEVAELRMLRWMNGNTPKDMIKRFKADCTLSGPEVDTVDDKTREKLFRWFVQG